MWLVLIKREVGGWGDRPRRAASDSCQNCSGPTQGAQASPVGSRAGLSTYPAPPLCSPTLGLGGGSRLRLKGLLCGRVRPQPLPGGEEPPCLKVSPLCGLTKESDPVLILPLSLCNSTSSLRFLVYKMGTIAPPLWLCYDRKWHPWCKAGSPPTWKHAFLGQRPHPEPSGSRVLWACLHLPGCLAGSSHARAPVPGCLAACSALPPPTFPAAPSSALGAPSRSSPLHLN